MDSQCSCIGPLDYVILQHEESHVQRINVTTLSTNVKVSGQFGEAGRCDRLSSDKKKEITYNWEMRKEGREGRKRGGRERGEEERGQEEGEGGSA